MLGTWTTYLSHCRSFGKSKNQFGCTLGNCDDERRRVGRWHSREDARINYKYIIGTINFGVCVNHCCSILEPAISPNLGSAEPVICSPGADICVSQGNLEFPIRYCSVCKEALPTDARNSAPVRLAAD
jgi:hypothetical protein